MHLCFESVLSDCLSWQYTLCKFILCNPAVFIWLAGVAAYTVVLRFRWLIARSSSFGSVFIHTWCYQLPPLFSVLCNVARCHSLSSRCFPKLLGYTGSSKVFFNTVCPSCRWSSCWPSATCLRLLLWFCHCWYVTHPRAALIQGSDTRVHTQKNGGFLGTPT